MVEERVIFGTIWRWKVEEVLGVLRHVEIGLTHPAFIYGTPSQPDSS